MSAGRPGGDAEPAILFDRVSKAFGSFTALADVTLSVARGEFVTLLGPSGSGKSTILNMIAGSLAPTAGRVLFGSRDMAGVAARDRNIGMVFQNYALMPHMTVFDNVAFALRIRRWATGEIRTRVAEVLDRVGLGTMAGRRPAELSGGQQQRVSIARCLAYAPPIILMDEPLGALDRRLRDQMQEEIKRLHKESGTTFVYVTHDQEEALNLSDRICLMSQGAIEQLGTPAELYFAPKTVFTAEFLGDSNLLQTTCDGDGAVRLPDGTRLKVAGELGRAKDSAVQVLVRPERIRLAAVGDQLANAMRVRVAKTSFVGGMTRFELESERGLRLLMKTVSMPPHLQLSVGSVVDVGWSDFDTVVLPH